MRIEKLFQVENDKLWYQIYENDFVDENLDTVMELLTESQWDDTVENLRPIRNRFCELAEVPAPTVLKKNV